MTSRTPEEVIGESTMSKIKNFDKMNDEERKDWAELMAELCAISILKPLYSSEQLAEEKRRFDRKWAKYGPFDTP